MAEDWSRAEVEATVADYFDMLDHELRGRGYNKSAHRRRLAALLNHRTDGAVERKHQNINAILIELGFVYVVGYKPLRNGVGALIQRGGASSGRHVDHRDRRRVMISL